MEQPSQSAYFSDLRRRMVERQLQGRGISDSRVLQAMARVPRHEFVPEHFRSESYEDHPLPIGEEQTISQPYIVALMLQALTIRPTDRVLEVGTGSGYVTALLAEMAAEVISIERHVALADHARELLHGLGYSNITVVAADGSLGYPARAPYDVILVSAAAAQLPPALVAELAEEGRMIAPIGADESQQLHFVRMEHGHPRIQAGELCRFVPLVTSTEGSL